MAKKLVVGDYVILKGQRKGRHHLEGGVIASIEGANVVLNCEGKVWVMPLADIEPFSAEYVDPINGNQIVPYEGARYIV